MSRIRILGLLSVILCIAPGVAQAHFPWVIVDHAGKPTLFFGEGLSERTYKLPPPIAKAQLLHVSLDGQSESIATEPVESDDLLGLQASDALTGDGIILTHATYGNYHGSLLKYTALHQVGELPTEFPLKLAKASKAKLFAYACAGDAGIKVVVKWEGQPLGGTEVHLYSGDGNELATKSTAEDGTVSFDSSELATGLHGVMLGNTVKVENEDYESESTYVTLTFDRGGSSEQQSMSMADLPFEVTSFGAIRVGDVLYCYGGHTGDAHSYSTEEQSNQLIALDISKPGSEWKTIAKGERLQGLGMAAYKNKLILVGGFTAKNERGDEHDLHSQPTVHTYDLETGKWAKLADLPAGRSSHDAAVVGDKLYVVGGWTMAGEDETEWHDSAWSLDLSEADAEWKALPQPPFKRRALATVAHDGKLFVIGGMDNASGPTRAVSVFDPATKQWSDGPELAGDGRMAGFGAAGWSVGGDLIVTTYEGRILRLAKDGKSWDSLGQAETSRFFHRLLPHGENQLISVGGANMEEGKYLELELITIED